MAIDSLPVFIHVGLHKTASTWLQDEVFNKLQEFFLVSRPYTTLSTGWNKLLLANNGIFREADLESELKEILVSNGVKKLLLSDENFSGMPNMGFINQTQVASRLSALFPRGEIILFLRGQLSLLRSLHNQAIKTGWFSDPVNEKFLWLQNTQYRWDDYLKGDKQWDFRCRYIHHHSHLNLDNFNYLILIKLYESLFPKLHLFLYEDLLNQPEKVVRRICDLLEDRLTGKIDYNPTNPSISSYDLKKKRIRNRVNSLSVKNRIAKAVWSSVLWLREPSNRKLHIQSETYLKQIGANAFFNEVNTQLLTAYPGLRLTRYSKEYGLISSES